MLPYPPGEPLTVRQIRELDILAIEHVGIPGIVLMENAGRSAAEVIYGLLPNPPAARVVVLCGSGNNGGDGFVIARHLRNAGTGASVILALPAERSRGDAGTNLAILQRMGCPIFCAAESEERDTTAHEISRAELIVDALLGTGATGAPRGDLAELITQANAARGRRIAIDIPSGLNADTGEAAKPCFRADCTLTLVAEKAGFAARGAADVLGYVRVLDIGAPRNLIPGRQRLPESVTPGR